MSRASKLFAGALAFVAASAVTLANPAHAQPGVGGPGAGPSGLNIDTASLLKAKTGAWADYTMTGKGATATVRYAVVDRSASKLALEVISTLPQGAMVLHLDFTAQGDGASAQGAARSTPEVWKVTAGKMQLGDQKKDFPPEQLASAPPLKAGDTLGVVVGTESLSTPLGALSCKHYKREMTTAGQTLEVWANEKVSPTGVVKSTIEPAGFQMTLTGTGTGAQAKL